MKSLSAFLADFFEQFFHSGTIQAIKAPYEKQYAGHAPTREAKIIVAASQMKREGWAGRFAGIWEMETEYLKYLMDSVP